MRRFVGSSIDAPFNKSHVEVGYSDENQRKWMFLEPIEGTFPTEGTREAATDTRVLALLGIDPVVGKEFTITFDVDGVETTETFILSGWWQYDEAIVASHVILPLSGAEEIYTKLGTKGADDITGRWNMDVMFKSSMNIDKNIETILNNHGYQNQKQGEQNFISIGVNWGYTGDQLADSMDSATLIGVIMLILLIIFTGYLIIYNVFQISIAGDIPEGVNYEQRALKYRDVTYQVAALVTIPHSLSYRYYGSDEFVLGANNFIIDTQSNTTMYYAFDTTKETNATMENFLYDFTQNTQSQYDYESKETYKAEFESFRNMFLIFGSVLSFIIGIVGVLNFLNAVLTSIITRRKEFAMLQAIGMTGRQLKSMLIWESLYYTLGAVLICLILYMVVGPFLGVVLNNIFWFFTYKFTIMPILICTPFMIIISLIVPYYGYKNLVKQSVVERLREIE